MTSSKDKILFFFTNSYPYGNFEQNINIESEFFSKSFEKVYVFPIEKGNAPRNMPANFQIVDINKQTVFKKGDLFKYFFSFIAIFFAELIKTPFSKGRYISNFSVCIKKLYNAYSVAKGLASFITKEDLDKKEIHFYSYWFYHWAIVFAFFKRIGSKKVNTVSRGHMSDMYQEPYDFPFNPFHHFKLKYIDKFFATSEHGCNYLKKSFPAFADSEKNGSGKIFFSRSGVFTEAINPLPQGDELIILTCSTFHVRKRIYMMPEILKKLNFNVRWVHFGEGPERVEVEKDLQNIPANVRVEFKGFIQNPELFKYYETQPISVFLNLSIMEGVPFSIIEAVGYGIPIIATDVYGTPEVCTKDSGMLLPKDLNAEIVANTLRKFKDSEMNMAPFRKKVKALWDRDFNSDKNYTDFIQRAFQIK